MPEYFETKSKFLQQQDNGLVKAVTELHLVDAMTFTEAETRIHAELAGERRELILVTCKRSNISEVVEYGDTDLWFRVKITYTATIEDSDKEKKIVLHLLVNANDVTEAETRTRKHLETMLVPFEIPSIVETKIANVFHYVSGLRAKVEAAKTENPNAAIDAKHGEEE